MVDVNGNAYKELLGSIIGLARVCLSHEFTITEVFVVQTGLALLGKEISDEKLDSFTTTVKKQKDVVAPGCAICQSRCGNSDDFNVDELLNQNEEIKNKKLALLREIIIYSSNNQDLKSDSNEFDNILSGLFALGYDGDSEYLDKISEKFG